MDCKLRFSQSFADCVGAWVWAGVHVASAQCCACSHRRLSRRPRVRSALAMLSSDDNSEDGAPPARRQAMPSSPLKPGAPASMTALAPLVQTGEANSWVVRVGDNAPAFLFARSPTYNRIVSRAAHSRRHVAAIVSRCAHDPQSCRIVICFAHDLRLYATTCMNTRSSPTIATIASVP